MRRWKRGRGGREGGGRRREVGGGLQELRLLGQDTGPFSDDGGGRKPLAQATNLLFYFSPS